MSVLREFLQGIRLIKLQAKEDDFKDRIRKHYHSQLQFYNLYFTLISTKYGIKGFSLQIIAVCSFLGYFLMGGSLTASIIIPSLVLFDISSPLGQFTSNIQVYFQSRKPLKEIEEFLLAEELNHRSSLPGTAFSSSPSVLIKNAEMKYCTASESGADDHTPFSLEIEELTISTPSFYGIEGPVGSGKSTLLKALLNEVTLIRGSVEIRGSVAYCAQEPWIMQSSIEDNIVFGCEYDSYRLTLVVESCGLHQDLLMFPNGIKTEIGESGVNLSGGQKSRVALARAVYSNADIYLLDNPLAACDSKVSRRIFARLREVLKDKIVLMVSNSHSLLSKMDYSIALENGLMKSFTQNQVSDYSNPAEDDLDDDSAAVADSVAVHIPEVESFAVEEEKEKGRVKSSIIMELLRQVGTNNLVLLGIAAIFSLAFSIANPFWLSRWTDNKDDSKNSFYLIGYTVLGLMDSISSGLQLLIYAVKISALGQKYHLSALDGLIKADMTFFDTNPVGRILNRMNADVSSVDRSFGFNVGMLMSCTVSIMAAITVITCSSPYMAILIAFFGVLVHGIGVLFYPGLIEQNRPVPLANSNLFSSYNEILEGSSTIVSHNQTSFFLKLSHKKQDLSFGANFAQQVMEVWMDIRVNILSALITLAVSITACLVTKNASTSTIFGLALAYSLNLAGACKEGVFQVGINESRINSFERLRYYAKDLSYESVEGTLKVENWPARGDIELDSVQVAYDQRPDHLVIKNLSMSIKAGEKVGICGRTGCGKSTLVSSLFRLLELKSGMIKIDGVDISLLDLKTLRKGLQIIPQDPILFTGSIRSNLGDWFEDVELWEALERVGLKEYVQSLEGKLDSPVEASGSNMSYGQRQLICLARTFLAKPVILVMDEATASIDQESDERVQSIIKEHFKQATILSIAHRLESIADFDRILVLDQGELVEFDTPSTLLANPKSAFSQLVDAAGPETQTKIRAIIHGHGR